MKNAIIILVLLTASVCLSGDRTFKAITKDGTVSDIKQVEIQLIEPKTFMDSSVHTLNSIDLKISELSRAITSLTNKLQYWEDLREQVLAEAEKVELKTVP